MQRNSLGRPYIVAGTQRADRVHDGERHEVLQKHDRRAAAMPERHGELKAARGRHPHIPTPPCAQ